MFSIPSVGMTSFLSFISSLMPWAAPLSLLLTQILPVLRCSMTVKATVTQGPCFQVQYKNWNKLKLIFRWLLLPIKWWGAFQVWDRMNPIESTPVSTGTNYVHPVLLPGSVTPIHVSGCSFQRSQRKRKREGEMLRIIDPWKGGTS